MGAADEEKSPERREVTPRPELGVTRLQQAQAIKSRRPAAVIASNASKELEALAAHMPHIPDADARKLKHSDCACTTWSSPKEHESRKEVFL